MASRARYRKRLVAALLALGGSGFLLTPATSAGCDSQIHSALLTSFETMSTTAVELFFQNIESRGSFIPVTV